MANVRRIGEEEVPGVLAHLAASGGTNRSTESWQQDRMTALALGEARQLETVMPLARRRLAIAPGRVINAGWLSSNRFASRMSWRRRTRATAADWARLLPDVDALFVVRREDKGWGFGGGATRWYEQTGFHNVLALRCLYLEMEEPPGDAGSESAGRYHVQVIDPLERPKHASTANCAAEAWHPEMHSVYHDVYAACGGAPERTKDFWAPAIGHHFYREHYQFQIIGLWSEGEGEGRRLMGYAVVGWSGWHSKRPRMDILELATRQWDTQVAGDLIRTTCQLAWSKQVRQVRAVISVHDPYRGHLARTGFVDRWGYVMMAKWLHAQRYLDGLSTALPAELGDFWVQLAAPGEVPLVVGRGARSSPASSVTLQGDGGMITRLLLNRLDIGAALREGQLLSGRALSESDVARLSVCFPWTPWVFHMLDYI